MPVTWVGKFWWKQEGLDLMGERVMAVVAEEERAEEEPGREEAEYQGAKDMDIRSSN